jgi:hypothetical protein
MQYQGLHSLTISEWGIWESQVKVGRRHLAVTIRLVKHAELSLQPAMAGIPRRQRRRGLTRGHDLLASSQGLVLSRRAALGTLNSLSGEKSPIWPSNARLLRVFT